MEKLLRELYVRFNARDIDAVLEHLAPDVDWPNAWEGGRVRGHAEVRAYWTRQWQAIDGTVEPKEIDVDGDRAVVTVEQTVRDLDGNLLSEDVVTHVYEFRDGLVTRMDVEE
jgi:ketosteroid isomerase-like protein